MKKTSKSNDNPKIWVIGIIIAIIAVVFIGYFGFFRASTEDKKLVLETNTENCVKAFHEAGEFGKYFQNSGVNFHLCCKNLYQEQLSVMTNKEIREHAEKIRINKAYYSVHR